MKKMKMAAWCCLIAITLNTTGVYAQSAFKKALAAHLGLKSTAVSCNACHVKGKPKTMRNDLGELFAKQLAGKDVSKRLKQASADGNKKEVEEQVTKEFMEALGKIEKMPHPDGGTYAEGFKNGKVVLKP